MCSLLLRAQTVITLCRLHHCVQFVNHFSKKKTMCVYVSHVLLRHLQLWYSPQVEAAAEYRDVWELLVVKVGAATPHHNTLLACTHNDDLQLHR